MTTETVTSQFSRVSNFDIRLHQAVSRLHAAVGNIESRVLQTRKEISWLSILNNGLRLGRSTTGLVAIATILKPFISTRIMGIITIGITFGRWIYKHKKTQKI